MILIRESTLTNSEVFTGINNELNVKEKAINLIKSAKLITNEDIEAAYITVKQITDSLTKESLRAFDSAKVKLLYNTNPAVAMTQAIPFLTFNTKRGYETYVFVDKYITVTRDGVMKIEPSVLRDLLIGATIANGIKNNYSPLANDQYLAKTLMEIYSKLLLRVINREYSIAPDKALYDTVQYWVNRYFLTRVFELNDTEPNINKLALSYVKYLDETQLVDIKQQYDAQEITTISNLLDLIKQSSSRMSTLGLGTILNNWVNYYYASSMLAVDNIEYLIFMTICLLNGNGSIVNISASDIVKEAKNIKSYREELLKLIR